MESTGGTSGSTVTASASMPSPSICADSSKVFCSSLFQASNYEFDPVITEEERRFYIKAYPTVDLVRDRKTHCTVCKIHIGTAPVQEHGIKMHPILRVTHCNKCHDFYNSGEFSKGEDGSELYCRWCGQGGEVYCCSSCPYVFCKSCIVKNLSRGVVADIEQNENWNCFSCAPKILWPLRAQHWALMNYIEQQKKELYALNLSESDLKFNLSKDHSKCCRLAKAKCGNMSDSMESLDSIASKRSHSSSFSSKKPIKHSAPSPQQISAAKRTKSNDEVVCTPDLLSMLEPDCQITVPAKPNRPMGTPSASTPKIMSIQQPQSGYGSINTPSKNSAPPPLVLRNTAIKLRPAAPPPVVRRTIIGPRTPTPGGNGTPVYHTINGYRIDLNSAAQQETFRLPNGKLIQVKRQGPPPPPQNNSPSTNNWQQMTTNSQQQRVIPQTIASRPVQITQHPYNISVQQVPHPQVVRYHSNMIGGTAINPMPHNGTSIQVLNGGQVPTVAPSPAQHQQTIQQSGPIRPVMVRHVFPDNPIGKARSGLQDQVFNAMEICTHLTNKVQTLTNSNAYKQARSFLEVKELYIHLSYLLTYAIGRFKSLQDKCLGDMRKLGFGNDADSLENGQLAADKQASDDEDNEIEIVEPKTDLITLDSDDDEPTASSPKKNQQPLLAQIKAQTTAYTSSQHSSEIRIKQGTSPVPSLQVNRPGLVISATTSAATSANSQPEENLDLMSMAQSFLASMLEVDIQEGPLNSPGSDSSGQKKQPRKKLTSKPNPTLLKQKALMERERLEEMKRSDQKLKMRCAVELEKAEEVFPYAKQMLEARVKDKQPEDKGKHENEEYKPQKDEENEEQEKENETINSSTEEKHENENNANSNEITSEREDEITKFTVKISEGNDELKENDTTDKENSIGNSHKETSIEIIVELGNKSREENVQCEENESEDVSNEEMLAKLDNDEEKTCSSEKEDALESKILNISNENNLKSENDIEENELNKNGLLSAEKLPEVEAMETDESPPPVAAKYDYENPQNDTNNTVSTLATELEATNNMDTSNDVELEVEKEIEKILKPSKDKYLEICNKEDKLQENESDDNAIDDTCDVKHTTGTGIAETTTTEKAYAKTLKAAKDLLACEENLNDGEFSLLTGGLLAPAAATELGETTPSSNGII